MKRLCLLRIGTRKNCSSSGRKMNMFVMTHDGMLNMHTLLHFDLDKNSCPPKSMSAIVSLKGEVSEDKVLLNFVVQYFRAPLAKYCKFILCSRTH